jgi:carbon monoxide dehydrogenase subunit G
MRMRKSVIVAATPDICWEVLTTREHQKRWLPEVVDHIPDDPAKKDGVGATSTLKIQEGKRVVDYRETILAWEPGRVLAIRLSGGSLGKMTMDVTYRFTPEANGTRLDSEADMEMRGLFILLAPLFRLISGSKIGGTLARFAEAAK